MAHTLYKIYYRGTVEGDVLVYLGRTNQPLQNRLRGHLFNKPMHRKLDIDQVSRIEYAEFESEADMNLYEIYYILLLKPPLNVDDKTRDNLTVELPDVQFSPIKLPLWEKWREQLHAIESRAEGNRRTLKEIREQIGIVRSLWRVGEITDNQFRQRLDALNEELERITEENRKLGW